MKKYALHGMILLTLMSSFILTAQDKKINNYSFQKISPAASNQSGLRIYMLVGKSVAGTSVSEKLVLKGRNFLNLEWQSDNEILTPDKELPAAYSLEQNYPNPFNPVTRIKYSIPKESYVFIAIYNLLGEKVQQLVNESKATGTYTVEWNAEGFTSGIYMYSIKSGNYSESKKLLLLK